MIGGNVTGTCKGIEEVWCSQCIQGTANCSMGLECRAQVDVHRDTLCMVLTRLASIWKVIQSHWNDLRCEVSTS